MTIFERIVKAAAAAWLATVAGMVLMSILTGQPVVSRELTAYVIIVLTFAAPLVLWGWGSTRLKDFVYIDTDEVESEEEEKEEEVEIEEEEVKKEKFEDPEESYW